MKKSSDANEDCSEGGWKVLQQKLLSGFTISCFARKQLLDFYDFSKEGLENFVVDYVHGESKRTQEPRATPDNADEEQGDADQEGADDQDVPEKDPFAYIKEFSPHIELLEPGEFGKEFPFRCLLCKSKSWPEGKVGNLVQAKAKSVKFFLDSHCGSAVHRRNKARYDQMFGDGAVPEKLVPCEGLHVEDKASAGALYCCQKEFGIWASMSNLAALAKHTYSQVASDGKGWHIRAHNCEKECKPIIGKEHQVCSTCLALGASHSVYKSVHRFAMKFYSSKLLSSRLFLGVDEAQKVEGEIRESFLFTKEPKKMEYIINLPNARLQRIVRASAIHDGNKSHQMDLFHSSVIAPCLQVNVSSVPDRMSDILAKVNALVSSGTASEQDQANMKVAVACLSGSLDTHPMILGLALQCRRKLEKEERGVGPRGRRSKEGETERTLIAEAGLHFALHAGNRRLCKEFGVTVVTLNVMGKLEELSLPRPALAILKPEISEQNWQLLDQRFEAQPDSHKSGSSLLQESFSLCLCMLSLP